LGLFPRAFFSDPAFLSYSRAAENGGPTGGWLFFLTGCCPPFFLCSTNLVTPFPFPRAVRRLLLQRVIYFSFLVPPGRLSFSSSRMKPPFLFFSTLSPPYVSLALLAFPPPFFFFFMLQVPSFFLLAFPSIQTRLRTLILFSFFLVTFRTARIRFLRLSFPPDLFPVRVRGFAAPNPPPSVRFCVRGGLMSLLLLVLLLSPLAC